MTLSHRNRRVILIHQLIDIHLRNIQIKVTRIAERAGRNAEEKSSRRIDRIALSEAGRRGRCGPENGAGRFAAAAVLGEGIVVGDVEGDGVACGGDALVEADDLVEDEVEGCGAPLTSREEGTWGWRCRREGGEGEGNEGLHNGEVVLDWLERRRGF